MTATARILQADMERATMAAARAWKIYGAPTRVLMDLKNEQIEVIIGEQGESPLPAVLNEWDDE